MQGFEEEENSRLVFDTPQGRIVEVRVKGRHQTDQVADFYQRVLPTLAWRVVTSRRLRQSPRTEQCGEQVGICIIARRDTEILTLLIVNKTKEIKDLKGETVIYFSVHPE